jgi:hypothetical protein
LFLSAEFGNLLLNSNFGAFAASPRSGHIVPGAKQKSR